MKAKIDTIGKILVGGFGDKVIIGALMGLLSDVTPIRCYEYIRDGTPLFNLSDGDLVKYKKLAKKVDIAQITKERITDELRKYRPDLLGVIINTEGGDKWLNSQITELKKKLEAE